MTGDARIGDVSERAARLLEECGLLSAGQGESVLSRIRAEGGRFTSALVRLGGAQGEEILRALVERNGAETVEVDGCRLDPRVLHRLPEAVAYDLKVLPVAQDEPIVWAAVPSWWEETSAVENAEKRYRIHLEPIPVAHLDVVGILVKAHQVLRTRSLRERRIGGALVERGLISRGQLDQALALQKQKGIRVGQALLELDFLSADSFYAVLAERLHLPQKDSSEIAERLDPAIAKRITRSFAEHNMLLPYAIEGDKVRVAVSYPCDPNTIETLKSVTRARQAELCLVDEAGLRSVINAVFSGAGVLESTRSTTRIFLPETPKVEDLSLDGGGGGDDEQVDVDNIETGVQDDPTVPRVIHYMLYQAVKKGASDIHIEQYEDHVDTKFRIDGRMKVQGAIPVTQENVLRIISKIKIDSRLDIAERRKPQDGAFRKRFGERLVVDFRVAIQPTLYGENVVLRILDRTSPLPTLAQLGMPDEMLRRYLRVIENPQGMVVFTGPTGSGKTTTLYCTLDVLRKQQQKIITAEDPVEYQFDGIQQCQVNERIGNTFAKYLRGFLRQDPDVILIGEIRDQETAVMGTRAAITGHLLFTTIHASDAVGVVRRLCDMEVDPNMLATSLLAIVYQRLLRRICASCKAPARSQRELVEELGLQEILKGVPLYEGTGCAACDGEGYRGRIAIYEMWEPAEASRDEIARNADDRQLRQSALKEGLRALIVDGLEKVKAGITTLEELREVVPYNQLIRARDFVTTHP